MKCPRCQQENPAHARFCLGCGARLALACSACGTELPGGARFCLQVEVPQGRLPGLSQLQRASDLRVISGISVVLGARAGRIKLSNS